MNDQQLKEIEYRLNFSTPGPWVGDRRDGTVKYTLYGADRTRVICGNNEDLGIMNSGDEEFIRYSRTDIPDLIAEVRELRGLLVESCENIEKIEESINKWLAKGNLEPMWLDNFRDAVKQIRNCTSEATQQGDSYGH